VRRPARSTDEVARTLAHLDERGVRVVPYGGGSGVLARFAAAHPEVADVEVNPLLVRARRRRRARRTRPARALGWTVFELSQ
jgi:FAD/FMN-containing dehydrogenase